MRKIICLILTLVVSMSVFTGCNLLVHDYEYDYQQIVATVNPIQESLDKVDPVTKVATGEKVEFKSEKVNIYKMELIQYFQQVAEEYITNQGMTPAAALEQCVNDLITRELIYIEAEKRLATGEIVMDLTNENLYKRSIYSSINTQIATLCNTILDERDKDARPSSPTEEEKKTTYPIQSTTSDDDEIKDTVAWTPSKTRYPASLVEKATDSSETKDYIKSSNSLEREAMRRLVGNLEEQVNADFRTTAADKEKFKKDFEKIDALVAIDNGVNSDPTKGIVEIYPMLGETHVIYWLMGRNIEKQVKVGLLQNSITDKAEITVNDSDVVKEYAGIELNQRTNYDASFSAYQEVMKAGTETVYYHPKNSEYFYVKHILLPFSAAQTAELTAFKANNPNATLAQINARREQIAKSTVLYPHVNGEDDLKNPTNINKVYSEVLAAMAPLSVQPYAAERMFDNLIYKYNTDPGIFDKNIGYAVGPTPNTAAGETETYMIEFAEGSRKLKENGKVGDISEPILTDFGYHILYLANTISAGSSIDIYGYETPGQYKTYLKKLKATMVTAKEQEVFEDFQHESLTYYLQDGKTIVKFSKTYQNLIQE